MSARENFEGPHIWDKPGLSGYLVCLVHLVSLMPPNKPDRPNRPNEQDRLADCFSILLNGCLVGTGPTDSQGSFRYLFLFAMKMREREQ